MRRHLSTALSLVLFLIAWGVAACISAPGPGDDAGQPLAARPLPAGVNALEASLSLELAEMEGEEHPSLHNLFTLSPNIISGGEPATSAALEALALRGVKTIVSVDGKVPDSATAAQLGMRYVHIPIQYKGITEDELLALAKTFRELEAPFFVHCFHGRHRGPAAAAVGRLVLDGIDRTQALAEMRQWMGTSTKYAGLYATIASAQLPAAAESAAAGFAFPAAHHFAGFRAIMVETSRVWDRLALLSKGDWRIDPAHPDIDPRNEARQLADLYASAAVSDELALYPANMRQLMEETRADAEALALVLGSGGGASTTERPTTKSPVAIMDRLKAACVACHKSHRNR